MKVGPKIVDEGLVFCLDAANPVSYPGSGTTGFDLLQTNNTTLTNGPVISNEKGGGFVFDGTDDYINFEDKNPDYMDSTYPNGLNISFVIKLANPFPSTADGRSIITRQSGGTGTNAFNLSIQKDMRLRFWMTNTNMHYSNTYLTPGEIYICSLDLSRSPSNKRRWYINGSLDQETSWPVPTTTQQQNNFSIGSWIGSPSWYFPGTIYFVKIYNRSLSAQEIVNNYEATKKRFL
jgi:hypothetical protein